MKINSIRLIIMAQVLLSSNSFGRGIFCDGYDGNLHFLLNTGLDYEVLADGKTHLVLSGLCFRKAEEPLPYTCDFNTGVTSSQCADKTRYVCVIGDPPHAGRLRLCIHFDSKDDPMSEGYATAYNLDFDCEHLPTTGWASASCMVK